MQPLVPNHVHGVTHPGQGEQKPYSGSESDAYVCLVWQEARLVGLGYLAQGYYEVDLGCNGQPNFL